MKAKEKYTKETIKDFIDYMNKRPFFTKSDTIIKAIPEIKNSGYLRQIINDLRIQGLPIVSSSDGYKFSTDPEEILSTTRSLKSRANKILDAANGMEQYLIGRDEIK